MRDVLLRHAHLLHQDVDAGGNRALGELHLPHVPLGERHALRKSDLRAVHAAGLVDQLNSNSAATASTRPLPQMRAGRAAADGVAFEPPVLRPHAVDGPVHRARAYLMCAPSKRRPAPRRAARDPPAPAQRDFAVGADVEEQRNLVRPVHARRHRRRDGVRTHVARHAAADQLFRRGRALQKSAREKRLPVGGRVGRDRDGAGSIMGSGS